MKLFTILPALMIIAFGASAQQYRVINKMEQALNTSRNVYETYDSIHYVYHSKEGRGGSADNSFVEYDSAFYYTVNVSGKQLNKEGWKLYDKDDTLRRENHYIKGDLVWRDSVRYSKGRYVGNTIYAMQTYPAGTKLGLYQEKGYVYDSQGRVYAYGNVIYNPLTGYHDANLWTYGYDSQNRVITDSLQKGVNVGTYYPYQKQFYIYGATDLEVKYHLDYDATLKTYDTIYANYYSYNSSGQLVKDSVHYHNSSAGVQHEYTYYANGNLRTDSSYIQTNPASTVFTYTYLPNTARPETITDEVMNVTSGNIIYGHRVVYEYEDYWNVDVKNVEVEELPVKVYPNPAGKLVNVAMNMEQPGTINIKIFDVQGRMLRNISERADGEYLRQIPLHDFSSGLYVVDIEAGVKRKAIQIIVK